MDSGGVGGYFGARLADAGLDVSFIARGAHPVADAMKVVEGETVKRGQVLFEDRKCF